MDGWASLQAWANTNGGLVSLVIGVLGLLAVFIVGAKARNGFPSLGETLQDRASWPDLITRWRITGGQSYDAAVADIVTFADWLYGPRPLSWRAFDRCVSLAFVYPLIAVVLGWTLFNSHSPAGLSLFREGLHSWPRFGRAIALMAGLALSFWVSANILRFALSAKDQLSGTKGATPKRSAFFCQRWSERA